MLERVKKYLSEHSLFGIKPTLKKDNSQKLLYDLGNFGHDTYEGVIFEEHNQYHALFYFGKPSDSNLREEIEKYDHKLDRIQFLKTQDSVNLYYEDFINNNIKPNNLVEFVKSGKSLHSEFMDINNEESILNYLKDAGNFFSISMERERSLPNEKPELVFALRNDNSITKELVDNVINTLESLKNEGRKVDIICCSKIKRDINDKTPYMYTAEEFENLNKLNNWYKENKGSNLLFSESTFTPTKNKSWDYEQVKKANNELDKVCNIIKEKNLSPFEAVLFAYNYATDFKYSESNNSYESRTLPGLYNLNKIVCVNYAHLMKEIFARLNMPEVQVEINSCTIVDKKTTEHHANNIVTIKDEKYNINGKYRLDSCWDCVDNKGKKAGILNCLYPMDDVAHFKDIKYQNYYNYTMINLDSYNFAYDSTDYKLLNDNSPIISYKTYFNGLKNMKSKTSNFDEEKAEKFAYELIDLSAKKAKKELQPTAKSDFLHIKQSQLKSLISKTKI